MTAQQAIVNASLIPAAELISRAMNLAAATISAARDVLIERESFSQLSTHLARLSPILHHLLLIPPSPNNTTLVAAADILALQLTSAHALTLDCSRRNRLYLLLNCRHILRRLHSASREIARALSLLPLASLDLSAALQTEIQHLADTMAISEFRAAAAEEAILDRIDSAIRNRTSDRSFANNLLALIADAVGIVPTDRSTLRRELDEFREEVVEAKLRKDLAEAVQMDQIVALLARADSTLSFKEKEVRYYSRRSSLGSQQLEPLQSFYCPITRDVMEDPVETSSGHSFERSAIEKWFAEGNTTCPLTMIALNTGVLRPNITLRKSIEEWKERNTMITISSLKTKLSSSNEQEVLESLSRLQELCEERDAHREWVVLDNYSSVLVGLLRSKNPTVRNRSLSVLCILARDSDDAKENIAEVDNAIEHIVHSLARRREESKLAVTLLLELSKNDSVRGNVGKVQGCILLLVTISNSDNVQAASDAKELLETLSFLDENVVQMAKANHFKPLLLRLNSGPEDVKKIMLTTLAEMELTDHSKATIFMDGALTPLLDLVTHGNTEMKALSVKALQNLSSLQQNGLQMIREGAVNPLLDLLSRLNIASSAGLREQVAATIMNIAISVAPLHTNDNLIFLDSEDDIFRLFSLINLTGPSIQRSILRTFYAICQPPSAEKTRAMLRQCSAISVLIQHCENIDPVVRANAVKLLSCLMENGEGSTSTDHVTQGCLETLLLIIRTSSDEEEMAAAMSIITNLPTGNSQITQWLIDAEALSTIIRFLSDASRNISSNNRLIENAVGALCHFTVSTNLECQKRAAEAGVIPLLVEFLRTGTASTKQHAAISLAQFSQSSLELSRPIVKRGGFLCCSPPPEIGCLVHMGVCSVEISFCLLEANAVGPLVRLLGDPDFRVCQAALRALSTLIEGERLQSGSKVLDGLNGIGPMIKLLGSHSVEIQEKTVYVLERIFRLEEYKKKYGASAQMALVDLTQRGGGTIRASAARILAHLNVLHEQSSYF